MNYFDDKLVLLLENWLDDDSKMIFENVYEWVEKEIIKNRLEYQKNYEKLFSEKRNFYNLDMGFQGIVLPEENGGSGFNGPDKIFTLAAILMELSRGDASLGFFSAMQYSLSLLINKNSKLMEFYSSLISKDKPIAASFVMPGGCSIENDMPLFYNRSINVTAKKSKNGYILNGKNLRTIGNGYNADIYAVVFFDSEDGVGLAFVKRDAKGVSCSEPFKQTGLHGCLNADITLKNIEISREHLILGEEIINQTYNFLNLFMGAVSSGAATNFYEILYDWVNNRVIKGKGLMKNNPLAASVMSKVATDLTIAKTLTYNLATLFKENKSTKNSFRNIGSKIFGMQIQESCMRAINRGMELMASAGYAREWHAEQHWRDVKTIQSSVLGVGAEIPNQMDIAGYFYDINENRGE